MSLRDIASRPAPVLDSAQVERIRGLIRRDAAEWLEAYPEDLPILDGILEFCGSDASLLARLHVEWANRSPSTPIADHSPPPEPTGYVSVSDAAAHFGVSRQTVHNWLRAGKLGYSQPGGPGGRVLIPREELD